MCYRSGPQGCLFPNTHTGTVQEISEISCTGQAISVQGTAVWTVHGSHGVHGDSKGGKTDGHTQGYKDPPIPRQLVAVSRIPPDLSPAYTGSSENVSTTGLAGEFRKIRTGAQTSLQFCWLPVRPQVQSGPTYTGPVAEPSRENTEVAISTGLSGPAIHVLDRFTEKQVHLGRHHMRPIQWHLENNFRVPESLEKVIPIPRSLHPHLQWWLKEDNVLSGQPLHPIKHALQIFTDT